MIDGMTRQLNYVTMMVFAWALWLGTVCLPNSYVYNYNMCVRDMQCVTMQGFLFWWTHA